MADKLILTVDGNNRFVDGEVFLLYLARSLRGRHLANGAHKIVQSRTGAVYLDGDLVKAGNPKGTRRKKAKAEVTK